MRFRSKLASRNNIQQVFDTHSKFVIGDLTFDLNTKYWMFFGAHHVTMIVKQVITIVTTNQIQTSFSSRVILWSYSQAYQNNNSWFGTPQFTLVFKFVSNYEWKNALKSHIKRRLNNVVDGFVDGVIFWSLYSDFKAFRSKSIKAANNLTHS